jgi:hypothetical protein
MRLRSLTYYYFIKEGISKKLISIVGFETRTNT